MNLNPSKLMTEYLYQTRMVFKYDPFSGKIGPFKKNSLKEALPAGATMWHYNHVETSWSML